MTQRGRIYVRPSRPASFGAMIAGLFCLGFGLLVVVPMAGPFGYFWVFIALMMAASGAIGALRKRGLADRIIEVESDAPAGPATVDFDDKLRRLAKLKDDGLISDDEFRQKRDEIMQQGW